MLQCCNTCGIKDSSVRLNVALAAVEDCYIRFLIANNVVDDGVKLSVNRFSVPTPNAYSWPWSAKGDT